MAATHILTTKCNGPEDARFALEKIRGIGFPIEREEVIESGRFHLAQVCIDMSQTGGIYPPMKLLFRLGLSPTSKSIART